MAYSDTPVTVTTQEYAMPQPITEQLTDLQLDLIGGCRMLPICADALLRLLLGWRNEIETEDYPCLNLDAAIPTPPTND